jgi:hypothetical protein
MRDAGYRDRLKTKGIRQEDFRAICSIVLTKGLLARSDGGDSTRLYDIAARCDSELSEYLSFAFPVILTNAIRPPHFRLVPSHHRDVGLVDPAVSGRCRILSQIYPAMHRLQTRLCVYR